MKPVLAITIVFATICTTMCAQTKPASRPQVPQAKGGSKAGGVHARCDAQLGQVCVITLGRLRNEDGPHKKSAVHNAIGVKKGHYVVWIADQEENFQFSKFQRVDCSDETKLITDSKDPGPFDHPYDHDSYEKVKYAKVTGPVGNCYKHLIEVDPGHGETEHIDPHIMIEDGGTGGGRP